MARSDVSICNQALGHLGNHSNIQSLDEASAEAKQCKLFYEDTRDEVLRAHHWGFATKYVTMAEHSDTPPAIWEKAYAYPNDCLKARFIVDTSSRNANRAIAFQLGLASDGASKLIYTNQDTAVLCYTAEVSDPTVFDDSFANALSYAMAVKLAMPIANSKTLAADMQTLFQSTMASARTLSNNEGIEDNDAWEAGHIAARA